MPKLKISPKQAIILYKQITNLNSVIIDDIGSFQEVIEILIDNINIHPKFNVVTLDLQADTSIIDFAIDYNFYNKEKEFLQDIHKFEKLFD